VVIAADAISDIDSSAAEVLVELDRELRERGVTLVFAGLKGQVKDRLARYGLAEVFGPERFESTVGSAVNLYRSRHQVDWKDWDEV
jgi:anti-anti-sigma regulatory factor